MSSLADRIKISQLYYQHGKSDSDNGSSSSSKIQDYRNHDINLSIQFLLNCSPGTCHGGSGLKAYQFIHKLGYVPYDTCMNYIACSVDSTEGFCPHVDTMCNAHNTCRTCTRNETTQLGHCTTIYEFPNATVEEYGSYSLDVDAIMAEIYMRGPVQASLNATVIKDYTGGIIGDDESLRDMGHNHGVSIVGWGAEEKDGVERKCKFVIYLADISKSIYSISKYMVNVFFIPMSRLDCTELLGSM